MTKFLRLLLAERRGATAVEYGLIAALVVLAMMTALIGTANVTTGLWNKVSTQVQAH